jgi:DNA polymerase-4
MELLNQALTQAKQPIRLIGIGVSNLTTGRQLDLFDPVTQRVERLDRAVDHIRKKYGFTAIQTGRTLFLKDIFPETERGYTLHTPSLSR